MSPTPQLLRPDDRPRVDPVGRAGVRVPSPRVVPAAAPVAPRRTPLLAVVVTAVGAALATVRLRRGPRRPVPPATMPQRFGESYRWPDGTWTQPG